MRRLLVLMAGLGVLHTAVGCKHLAGVCDCAPPVQPCSIYGLYPAGYGAAAERLPAPAMHPQPPVAGEPVPPMR